MVGAYRVVIENAYIRYDFEIKRQITVVRGDSATGKTTLIDMINSWYSSESSGITLNCDKVCRVLSGRDWEAQLSIISDSIVFIDEQNRFIKTEAFAKAIKNTDNYYVLVTRENLPNLAYSVNEVYKIVSSGKYARLKDNFTENRFEQIHVNIQDGRGIIII